MCKVSYATYYENVLAQARFYGYSSEQVLSHSLEIRECYKKGISVEDCVDMLF